ncbi:shikimate dehydrogenase family protein [Aquimarina sp. W85]|uniref:shikimate dehydrogenase family protein n=1 Tax=Aquimarina rhodophyticola TaxID=3342246 RepID=UPI00366B93B2
MKKVYGLIGKNIDYSFSRKYFANKFSKEQLPCEYKNFDIENVSDFNQLRKIKNIKGFNVTIPYKEAILSLVDELDPIAENIGAINVIRITNEGKTIGYNSDYYGFAHALLPYLPENYKLNALILGTGGASKAVKYALQTLRIPYSTVSRKPSATQLSYSDINKDLLIHNQLIINTTPLGTYPEINQSPNLPYNYITSNHILYDLIYNPERTSFLNYGKQNGATIINGEKMLILQAEKSWEIWNL